MLIDRAARARTNHAAPCVDRPCGSVWIDRTACGLTVLLECGGTRLRADQRCCGGGGSSADQRCGGGSTVQRCTGASRDGCRLQESLALPLLIVSCQRAPLLLQSMGHRAAEVPKSTPRKPSVCKPDCKPGKETSPLLQAAPSFFRVWRSCTPSVGSNKGLRCRRHTGQWATCQMKWLEIVGKFRWSLWARVYLENN